MHSPEFPFSERLAFWSLRLGDDAELSTAHFLRFISPPALQRPGVHISPLILFVRITASLRLFWSVTSSSFCRLSERVELLAYTDRPPTACLARLPSHHHHYHPSTQSNGTQLNSMDQHDDFDSVSWRHDQDSDNSRPTTSATDADEPQGFGDYDTNGKRRMSSASQEEAAHHQPGPAGVGEEAADLAGAGEGKLECEVGSPLKENDGTKDAYVSYLITTHVGSPIRPVPLEPGDLGGRKLTSVRPTSKRSRSRNSRCAGDSRTFISYTRRCIESIRLAQCHRYRISTRWSTCAGTGSGLNSLLDEHGRCIGF